MSVSNVHMLLIIVCNLVATDREPDVPGPPVEQIDHSYQVSSNKSEKASPIYHPYEISPTLAQRFVRRCLKMLTMTDAVAIADMSFVQVS